MMRRMRSVYVLVMFVVIGVGILFALSAIQRRMNHIREEEELTKTKVLENAPPMVAFTTVALGAFRGLVADWLWLRSRKMKQEGKYFEMVQLGSWIVKLQPEFVDVAAYLAWNMSYNVSVNFTDPEARWRWVQRGIELLRDEALVYNPGESRLYHELGWIYQHKIGLTMDNAHRYYKLQLARKITKVVGDYPPDWEALAAEPRTKKAFRNNIERPETLKKLLQERDLNLEKLEKKFRKDGAFSNQLAQSLKNEGYKEPLERFYRSRWLRQVYRLKPELIAEINSKYGRLDWRLPQAHAVYWATRGREVADKEEVSTKWARMIYQSLQQAFRKGRLVSAESLEYFQTTPNIRIVDAINRAHLETEEKYGEQIVRGGYKNFVIDAVVILYSFGAEEKAKEYLEKGRKEWPDTESFKRPLRRFVLEELVKDIEGRQSQASAAVQSYLVQSCQALAYGDLERASALEDLAEGIWEKWKRSRAAGESAERRMRLPPYKRMKRMAVQLAMERFAPPLKKRLRKAIPEFENFEFAEDEAPVSGDTR